MRRSRWLGLLRHVCAEAQRVPRGVRPPVDPLDSPIAPQPHRTAGTRQRANARRTGAGSGWLSVPVRFSLRFNNDLPLALYPELARAAEAAGFDQFWVSDDLFLRGVWVILSSVAQATSRIQIGTCIVNPYTLHPAEMAMAAATLDELSGGRLLLGISSGAQQFLQWIGLHAEHPLAAVAESMAALRRLWRGERVHPAAGAFLAGWSPDAYLRFPSRAIPVYVGAMSPRMLRLIGQAADGGLPLLLPPEHFADAMAFIRAGAVAAGRAVDDIDVAACIWCSIARDRQAAEAVLRDKIAYYGGEAGAGWLAVFVPLALPVALAAASRPPRMVIGLIVGGLVAVVAGLLTVISVRDYVAGFWLAFAGLSVASLVGTTAFGYVTTLPGRISA